MSIFALIFAVLALVGCVRLYDQLDELRSDLKFARSDTQFAMARIDFYKHVIREQKIRLDNIDTRLYSGHWSADRVNFEQFYPLAQEFPNMAQEVGLVPLH